MLRNFLTLGSGEAVARVLYVGAFLWLARQVGPEPLGEFGFALTVASYLSLFVQQGIDQVAVRQVSREPESMPVYAREILGLRLWGATASFTLLIIFAKVAPLSNRVSMLLVICGFGCFSTAVSTRWIFQARGEAKPLAIAAILAQLIFVAGVLATKASSGVCLAAVGQVLGEGAAAAYLWRKVRPRSAVQPRCDWLFGWNLLRVSFPVTVSLFLGTLLYNFDVLALGWFSGASQVGLYLAVYRCATVFSPLLSMLQVSVLPEFSRQNHNRQTLWTTSRSVMLPAFAVSVLGAVFFTVFTTPVLHLLYGSKFLQGGPILKVLSWSLPFQTLRSVLRQTLIATHHQRRDTANMALAVFASVCLDLLLVPHYGAYACAWATLASEIVLFTASYQAARQATRVRQ